MTRSKHNITLDDEVWKKAGEVLESVGLSRSKFIEITLRGLARSAGTAFGDVVGDINMELFQSARPPKKKPK